jgi:EmrB/QacA subfamily drug resistance transporter
MTERETRPAPAGLPTQLTQTLIPNTAADKPRRQREGLILATLCAGMFMAMLDNVVVSNALPRMGRSLDAGITGLQWAVEGYSLVFAALLLPGGTLGDRWGRRRAYLAGLALFTAGSALTALAPNLAVLLTGRAAQGLGAAALVPQSLAILRVTYPDLARQAKAFSIWSSVSALGLALGPAIGGPLVERFGWPSAFWINVPIGLAALALAVAGIPDIPGRTTLRGDYAAQAALAAALALLVYALVEGPDRGWRSAPVAAGLVGALLAAVAFWVARKGKDGRGGAPPSADRALDLSILRSRTVATAVLAGFTVTFGMFGVITFLGLFLQDVLRWSPAGAGLSSLPSTALIIVTSPLAARLTLKRGPRLPLTAGLVCCAAALLVLSLFGAGATYPRYFWALPLMGIGMGLCYTPVTIVMMTSVPLDRAGNASALSNTSREIGGAAGIAVMGSILTALLRASLGTALAAAHVPSATAHAVLAATTAGGSASGFGAGTALPDALRPLIASSFVSGLHAALWAAAGLLALGGILVWLLLRPRGL